MNAIIEEDIRNIINSSIVDWTRFRNKNVLITGANGMLPSYMVLTLLKLNAEKQLGINVYALARNESKLYKVFNEFWNNADFHPIIQNVCDEIQENVQFDFIIHAASQASSKYFATDPVGTLKANSIGTINALDAAVRSRAEAFLFFSSASIYGDLDGDVTTIDENVYGKINPISVKNCYTTSKVLGENACVSYFSQYGLQTKIVRIFHTMGPMVQLDDCRIFSDLCQNIVKNEDIVLHSDGSAKRVFCYVADAVEAYFKVLLDGDAALAYNVGGNEKNEISMRDLAEMLVSLFPQKKLKVIRSVDVKSAYRVSGHQNGG